MGRDTEKKRRMGRASLKGKYFLYCQWCRRDGHCILRHYQFLGTKSSGQVDRSFCPGHEDLAWHLSGFQQDTKRTTCNGRIYKTDSVYYPLQCECGTAISSLTFSFIFGRFCAKFQPNENGKERLRIAEEIAEKRGIELSEVDLKDLPEPDPNYVAAMMY